MTETHGSLDKSSPSREALTALDGLFATHEIRVLGLVGILTGYICILFVKMMGLSSPFIGIGGIVLITLMLLFLDPQMNLRSFRWWVRVFSVVIMSIVISSPQMYDAWTVAVREAKNEALVQLAQPTQSLPELQGKGTISRER
jgi:hypothetical protein